MWRIKLSVSADAQCLVELVTQQVWNKCPAQSTMTSVKAQSHAWMMAVMVSGMASS